MDNNITSDSRDLSRATTDSIDWLTSAASQLGKGVLYGAIESPVNALTQAVDNATGAKLPQLAIAAPQPDSTAGKIGEFVGAGIDIYLLNRAASPLFDQVGLAGTSTAGSALRLGMIGSAYSGLMVPSDVNSQSFWTDRAKAAAVGGATFASFALGGSALDSTGMFSVPAARSLMGSTTYGALTGAGAGVVNAETSSLLNNGTLASGGDLLKTAGQFSVLGGAFGATGYGYEQASRMVRDAQNPLPTSFKSDDYNSVQNIVRDAQGNVVQATLVRPSYIMGKGIPVTEQISKMTDGTFDTNAWYEGIPSVHSDTDGMAQLNDGSLAIVSDQSARIIKPDGQGVQFKDMNNPDSTGIPGLTLTTDTSSGTQKIESDRSSQFNDDKQLTEMTQSASNVKVSYDNSKLPSLVNFTSTDGNTETNLILQRGATSDSWTVRNGAYEYQWNGKINSIPNGSDGSLQFIPQGGSAINLNASTDVSTVMKSIGSGLKLLDDGSSLLPALKVDAVGNITLVNPRASGALRAEIDGKAFSNQQGATTEIKPGTNLSIRDDYGDTYPMISNRQVQWGTTVDGVATVDGTPLLPNTVVQLNAGPEEGKVLTQPLAVSSANTPELSPTGTIQK